MEAFTEGWYVQRETKKRDAERAVIEAAKALVEAEAMDFDGGEPLTSAEQALVTAVEELLAAEKGEP